MDAYYPYLAGINLDSSKLLDLLSDFYVPGMGIKCVKEEPWVTFAESSEAIISLIRVGEIKFARKIMSEIENFKNEDGIFPTGYQYSEKIFWPDKFGKRCKQDKGNRDVSLLFITTIKKKGLK